MNTSHIHHPQSYDIIIIGGGIVGLTFAGLLPASLRIALIETQSAPIWSKDKYDLRVSAINTTSQNIFEKLSAWSQMQTMRISPFYGMKVWEMHGGKIEFDCFDIGMPQLGHIIENRVIQQALWEKIREKDNVSLIQAAPEKILAEEKNVTLILKDGQILKTQLLVGADGANSWVRDQTGIEIRIQPYEHSAIVTTVRTELPHQKIARQRFFGNNILAFLPLTDLHLCSIVWSTTPDEARKLSQLNTEEFNRRITSAFDQQLGMIEKIDAVQTFSLYMRHAKQYVKHRIALIGDAAHTIHPLAGQGLNLGLMDAAYLAKTISEAMKKHRDIGHITTLRRFERARKSHNLLMLGVIESFKRLFTSDLQWLIPFRSHGLNFTDKTSWLKQFFMRQASGL